MKMLQDAFKNRMISKFEIQIIEIIQTESMEKKLGKEKNQLQKGYMQLDPLK